MFFRMNQESLNNFCGAIIGADNYALNNEGQPVYVDDPSVTHRYTTLKGSRKSFIEIALQYIRSNYSHDLNHKASSNDANINDCTPLYLAAANKNTPMEIFTALLKVPEANYNQPQQNLMTPLLGAAKLDNTEKMKALLQKVRIDVNAVNNKGESLLHFVIRNNSEEIFQQLFAEYPILIIDQIDSAGETPLHIAARFGFTQYVKKILTVGTHNLSHKNLEGETPLHLAAKYGHPNAAKLLWERPDIELNLLDIDGHTAADWAKKNKHPDLNALIIATNLAESKTTDKIKPYSFAERLDRINYSGHDIPKDYCCPVSCCVMEVPITFPNGQSYDRQYLLEQIEKSDDKRGFCCPLTKKIYDKNSLLALQPNIIIKNLIDAYITGLEQKTELQVEQKKINLSDYDGSLFSNTEGGAARKRSKNEHEVQVTYEI